MTNKDGWKTALGMAVCAGGTMAQAALQFDFGAADTEPGYVAVGNATAYSSGLGYGWVSTSGLNLRDRGVSDALRTDFIFNNTSSGNIFRISGLMPNGRYRMTVICGDADYGDHVITIAASGMATQTLSPNLSEYLALTATVTADASGLLEITFGSPTPNWVVNSLTLDVADETLSPSVESQYVSEWDAAVFADDPTQVLLDGFSNAGAADFVSTGLTRADYLTLMASEVDYWKSQQNSSGAIIDPYTNGEVQYSTPAYANAAAALVVYGGRSDLLESAALAVDWAAYRLSINAAANGHDDFYPGMLANAYRLLAPRVDAARAAQWAAYLSFEPFSIYDYAPGSFNWTVVSSCGEALLQLNGIREYGNAYASVCWAAQGRHFTSPYGLYEEGPMGYDHFPRIWFADALAQGYDGPFSEEVGEAMDRAAVTSLFMMSPWGELPAGGRSAHHQWNEAAQCITFEIYAAKAKAAGDLRMAAAYKRGAHLSLASLRRWVRTEGEMAGAMQVVKNRVDPASRHGYESYSYNSQYNILPMAMLAIAYEHAEESEEVPEGAAPSDTGGFLFQLDHLHKVFANAGGTYVELDTSADHHYDATGLIRVHQKNVLPQLGPSDTLLAGSSYNSTDSSPITTGVGVSWLDSDGATWRTLGELGSDEITSVSVVPISKSPEQVVFEVTYTGALPNVESITEHYTITAAGVELTTELSGYDGALRYMWPVLSNDGATASTIGVRDKTVSVSQGGTAATFTASGASSVRVGTDEYSNRNGWARIGVAEFPEGGAITLQISSEEPTLTVLSTSPEGDTSDTTPVLEAVIEDGGITVDPDQLVLLLDGSVLSIDSVSKIGTTTTVSGTVSVPLEYGEHTAGLIAGVGALTNEWTFNVAALSPIPTGNLVYVDATDGDDGNTTLADGSILEATDSTGGSSWRQRDGSLYGSGGTIFEGVAPSPVIKTTLSGLVAGQGYSIYVFFGEKDATSGEKWNVRAGLSEDSLTLFANPTDGISGAADAVKYTTLTFENAPGFSTSYPAYAGWVGAAMADENGQIEVFVDDYGTSDVNLRSWYDGIGYQTIASMIPTNVAMAVSNGVLTLSWPESHKGWMLQSTTNLVDGAWQDVDDSVLTTLWDVSNTPGSAFFRIRYPAE